MSAAPATARTWGVRLAIVAVVGTVITYGVSYALRPTAQVVAAFTDKAVDFRPGTVEVKAEFDRPLTGQVPGRILTSELEIGRRFFKGDPLVVLDTGDIDLDIERTQIDLASAKKKLEIGSTLLTEEINLRIKLEEAERQMKAGFYPAADYEKDKRVYDQAVQRRKLDELNLKQAVESLENSLKSKLREKSKMTIVAPADGIVTAVISRPGDLIGANNPIATLISVNRTIEAKISEDNFNAIKEGQKATVRFLTFGDEQYPAVISKVLPSADFATQRYSVYLDVTLPEGKVLLPGLTGEVQITIAERPNATVVPRRSLVGDFVYVVTDGKVELRKVEKGYESLSTVEILKGIKKGELVIVEKQDTFHSGDHVRTHVLDF
ncbi:MAG TPA: efflux RND transporter periplasmic adaptor subunit [Lacunisphaera sp.]|nr:efflux RND transporter periplasmic adaptor subunit [Lacunisphaera sp.]